MAKSKKGKMQYGISAFKHKNLRRYNGQLETYEEIYLSGETAEYLFKYLSSVKDLEDKVKTMKSIIGKFETLKEDLK